MSVSATPAANDGDRLALILASTDTLGITFTAADLEYHRRANLTTATVFAAYDRVFDPAGAAEAFDVTLSASTAWLAQMTMFKTPSAGQLMLLDEDVTVSGFEKVVAGTPSSTNLWQALNESVRDDTTYIRTTGGAGTKTYIGRYAPPSGTPAAGTCTPGAFPVGKDSAGGTVNATINIRNGPTGTVVSTITQNNIAQGFTVITPPQFDSSEVTDWSNLCMELIMVVSA